MLEAALWNTAGLSSANLFSVLALDLNLTTPIEMAGKCQHYPETPLQDVEHEGKISKGFLLAMHGGRLPFWGNGVDRHFYWTDFIET